MIIKSRKKSDCAEYEVTDQSTYLNRRQFIQASTVAAIGVASPSLFAKEVGNGLPVPNTISSAFNNIIETPYGASEKVAPFDVASSYNNFYEFGYGKGDPAEKSSLLKTDPWSITVEGEADITGTFALEDIINENQLEERIYRLRCVEAWSMVVPWVGISLASVLQKFKPNSKAKYVYFETLHDPNQMPGQRSGSIEWPYREGLTIEEAMNKLAFLSVGMYGSVLPNQNGAPVRLVVPWKYGFKSIKSIVKIRFVEKMPKTTWNMLAPQEYGFYANVNPGVDHPRWTQKQERRLPGGILFPNVIETQMFNGYAEEVSDLYSGMNLVKNF
ncbi:protein-methionine-sulfoxide reductase catalytic subunit MsrP [Marinomonas algicola]|uniref:protein-methionine-sulfoxide reductase catalytic subunit MsrP n=1 Tax=Marinomonas algicola TaxID=2773454 RepID=UPI00174D0655|nr:protein-methionine-sulfoxide reductase catalytic subunit MsrP [Marinomonas algicola]